jgi:hypothetical protein
VSYPQREIIQKLKAAEETLLVIVAKEKQEARHRWIFGGRWMRYGRLCCEFNFRADRKLALG